MPFQDPENVGAVIRSAAAFGVPRVVLLKEAAHPFHPKAARAAGTALFQVGRGQGPSSRDVLSPNVRLLALSADGPEIEAEGFPDRFGLVAGLEGPGLPDHLQDRPDPADSHMEPGVESAPTPPLRRPWPSTHGDGPRKPPRIGTDQARAIGLVTGYDRDNGAR